MSIKHDQERREFQDSLRSFFSEHITSEYLRRRIASSASDAKLWEQISSLGVNEYFSDSDSRPGIHDLFLVSLESGRALLPEALSESILAGPFLAARMADADSLATEVRTLLSSAAVGARRGSVVLARENSLKIELGKTGAAKISGKIPAAPGLRGADYILLCFESYKDAFLVPLQDEKIVSPLPGLDKTLGLAEINFSHTTAYRLTGSDGATLYHMALALRAAELAGVAQRGVVMTVEYVKTRKQFGVPIGGFQALQHKLADMHLQAESMRSLANFACWAADNSSEQFELAARSALMHAAEAAPLCLESAIQVHGGIGFTWEFDLHLFLRRAKALAILFGPSTEDYSRLLKVAAV